MLDFVRTLGSHAVGRKMTDRKGATSLLLDDVLSTLILPGVPLLDQHHLKFLCHPDRVLDFLVGRWREIRPVTAELVPSLECPLRCPHCTYAFWKEASSSAGRRLMAKSDMFACLDKMRSFGIKGVIFTGGGEPFANEHTVAGVIYASELGLEAGVFTNGYLVDPRDIPRIVTSAAFLRLSLNAVSEDVYQRFHGIEGQSPLSTVMRNVVLLARAAKCVRMRFGIGVVVNEVNVGDLIDVASFVAGVAKKEGGISYVGFRPVINYRRTSMQIHPSILQRVSEVKADIDRMLHDVGVNAFWTMDHFTDAIEARSGLNARGRCLANPWAVSVAYDGGVYLCSEHDGDPDFLLGSLRKQSFEHIWAGQRRRSVMDAAANCTAPVCKLRRLNKILNAMHCRGIGLTPLSKEELTEAETILRHFVEMGEPDGKHFL